uniref:MAM domain-containing protein n=1 Tax=Magallana gigas TaxID=29159 RepID=A0A8W8LTG9_MAGGI
MRFRRSLPLMVSFIELINGCIQFKFSREVSFLDNSQMLGTYPASSKQGLFGVCAPRCNNDIRCNAIDICFENLKCKLISGRTPLTPGNVSEGVCKRFQMNSTPSFNTGPSSAVNGSYYKYIETSRGEGYPTFISGQRAILESFIKFSDITYCLAMYYHMYGGYINTLTIRTQKGNNTAIDRWILSGNQGDAWHHLSGVNLPLDSQSKIIIEATKGAYYEGDIAIDSIELLPFACP